MPAPTLVPRAPVSLDELLAGCSERHQFLSGDSKSGTTFERVVIGGDRHIVKYMHVDDDWIMRASGDLRGRPWVAWQAGLMDAVPGCIETAVVGVATGLGRNGWGTAVLMRDVGEHLVPEGDEPVSLEVHRQFIEHLAVLSAHFWGFRDDIGLTPLTTRYLWFSDGMIEVERQLGNNGVPAIAAEGWVRFGQRAPRDVVDLVRGLRAEPLPFVTAIEQTPMTFLHGDWKMGNLGATRDGHTILLDWAGPGQGPACSDLGWYLALNRARIPESKESAIEAFRAALERQGIATSGWWDRQLPLALLGTLVLFGWEKALGDTEELGWWCDRAREGGDRL
ncbi:MAG TPA: phosphotransferase [Acidimicrobiales bacterium]